jgi:hypothetical protein
MFNVFDSGHALPLRVRRFSCCARLHAIQRVSQGACCIRSFITRASTATERRQPYAFALYDALLLEVLRHLLLDHCQPRIVIYEGHHHPA